MTDRLGEPSQHCLVRVTANGKIHLDSMDPPPNQIPKDKWSKFVSAFQVSTEDGLLCLATLGLGEHLPYDLSYWREFSRRYFLLACQAIASDREGEMLTDFPEAEWSSLLDTVPMMVGAEYITAETLRNMWLNLDKYVRTRIRTSDEGLREFLAARNSAWGQVGRVAFHLADNKNDEKRPFAFLVTYVSRISRQGTILHLPLGKALQEYAGSRNREGLLALLSPIDKVSKSSDFIRELVETGAIFRPCLWSISQAHHFLREIPKLESAGIVVKLPNWWKNGAVSKVRVAVSIGSKSPAHLGSNAILDFDVGIAIDGQRIARDEWDQLLNAAVGLVRVKGQWVEVDRDKVLGVLGYWENIQREMREGGISFQNALRMVSGVATNLKSGDLSTEQLAAVTNYSRVEAGQWLDGALSSLRKPELIEQSVIPRDLKANLRAYQKSGLNWLYFAANLRLGVCLADDMGLGKTIQVIALLLRRRDDFAGVNSRPSLLVVPASLIGNWKSEMSRFAPSLKFFIAHASECAEVARQEPVLADKFREVDVVVTTYGNVTRHAWLRDVEWDLLVLDEAQAVKNPNAKQTMAVKSLTAISRIALTGTPVENRLSDLWSLFDFLNPGLLGNAKTFAAYAKGFDSGDPGKLAPLKRLVKPYILRRMKTDKSVISDLPEKTEMTAYCALSRAQATLYKVAVDELTKKLETTDGMARRGLILSYLMRFKQICNHPAQWLGDGNFDERLSGKFTRLREICEEIASRQGRVLIFTQFTEMTGPLANYLADLFGRPGLVLTGETAVKIRQELVTKFQSQDSVPFFVLSLRAGGTGLNLTEASHVIHFDRWWNPAVENQATDRAFRIGQKRNVLVHKFVCRGTIEEKIDLMIKEKTNLSVEIMGSDSESGLSTLTEMSNKEIMDMVALDLNQILEDSGAR